MERIHFVAFEESTSNVSVITKAINDGENSLCAKMVEEGIDWIPRTILKQLTGKVVKLSKTPGALV